ncbi:glycosyltransferase [Parendozoicomonas haliclonae]|uniref:UDP-D-galactose:(Glucosyl)lipopolysaccharide-1, 6-D-galactosyltransferase n=1 Tax=Parendozoicomonas haliclonae TaxID=1960125 RepID=A0A1X7ARM6_9GAMM|nr:glycosyltransferase [Parendozoicomonas haliclonae]SMA50885.1 UDP-D-galactose:(glucosyl)lipopolysaccharide-1, 6-D-galactosyltransferase [Parendozoicomonas haliclonae]
MKVMHLVPILKPGGAPINILRFASKSNFKNILLSKSYSSELIKDAKKHTVYYDVDLSKPSVISFFKILVILANEKPDIVHTNGKSGLFYGVLLSLILKLFSIGLVHTYRGFYVHHGKWNKVHCATEKLYLYLVNTAICVSPSEKENVIKSLVVNASLSKKLKVIPNGIPKPINERRVLVSEVCKKYEINFVSFSRINYQKDIFKLIKVFEMIYQDGFALHIFGGKTEKDAGYYNSVVKYIDSLAIKEHIFLWGDFENASSVLHFFDIYMSTAIFEGLPTAIIEAGLVGLPVVATPCVGNVDLVNARTGYLASTFEVQDIHKELSQCLVYMGQTSQKIKIEEMKRLCNSFSIENNVRNIESIYSRLM